MNTNASTQRVLTNVCAMLVTDFLPMEEVVTEVSILMKK